MTKTASLYRDLFQLTKAEIVLLEVITLAAGFFIGHSLERPVNWGLFLLTFFGTGMLAGGSGALNQIQEHKKDLLMDRTRNRPIPSGRISLPFALGTAAFLFLTGTFLLARVSWTVLALGWLAVLCYNGLYTLWWKPKLAFAAVPGAIPGAIPVLIGYQAAIGNLADLRGIYLFALLFFWQMPHFWVLALKYSDDYDKGGFPTLPVAKGGDVTRFQITLWCLAYSALGLLSTLFFPTGVIGVIGCMLVSGWLLLELIRFLSHPEKKTWLRFFLSINFSLLLYLFAISADLWSILLHSKS